MKKKKQKVTITAEHTLSRSVDVVSEYLMPNGQKLVFRLNKTTSGEYFVQFEMTRGNAMFAMPDERISFMLPSTEEVREIANMFIDGSVQMDVEAEEAKSKCIQCTVQDQKVDGDYCLSCGKEI